MHYEEWSNKDDDPGLAVKTVKIELNPVGQQSTTNLVDDESTNIDESNIVDQPNNVDQSDNVDHPTFKPPPFNRQKTERLTTKRARMRNRGNQLREMENRAEDGEGSGGELSSSSHALRFIKVVALLLIGGCALVGMVFSKITFVSITSQMYKLYIAPEDRNNEKSTLFFQLVFILIIPEIICLAHCLIRGCVGKTSKTFPWPTWKAIFLVSVDIYL